MRTVRLNSLAQNARHIRIRRTLSSGFNIKNYPFLNMLVESHEKFSKSNPILSMFATVSVIIFMWDLYQLPSNISGMRWRLMDINTTLSKVNRQAEEIAKELKKLNKK